MVTIRSLNKENRRIPGYIIFRETDTDIEVIIILKIFYEFKQARREAGWSGMILLFVVWVQISGSLVWCWVSAHSLLWQSRCFVLIQQLKSHFKCSLIHYINISLWHLKRINLMFWHSKEKTWKWSIKLPIISYFVRSPA